MVYLVRRLTGGVDGEALDVEYEGQNLVIGSSEGAAVALPGLDGDVVVKSTKGGACKVSGRGLRLRRGDKEVSSAGLAVGEAVAAGHYLLTVIAPPTGFDTALQIEATAAVDVLPAEKALHKPPFSLRSVGWMLVLLVLVATLALPLTRMLAPPLGESLADLPLPDDTLWSSGPLHEAHQRAGIGDDCGACHGDPFVMVEDSTCLACHGQLTEHAPVDDHPEGAFSGERCGSCHREHNEPAHLVRRDPPLCTDCHAQPQEWPRSGEALRMVSGFETESHPEFRVAHWVPKGPNGSLGWELARDPGPASQVQDTSGLKFNHDVHLDKDKVLREQSGEALGCADCHTMEDSGEHFETVSMDAHCRDCHGLGFDSFEPDLELPHGDLRDVIVAMEAHFIREFTDPVLREARAAKKPRRLVGQRFREASNICEGSGLDCGRAEAAKEAAYQLEETGCVTCHEVTDSGREELRDRWLIHPVRLTDDFYVESRFDHPSHMSQATESADALCETCHQATGSVTSADILMPAQDNCLQCHGDQRAAVESDCVTCHSFHRASGSSVASTRRP